jgi:hypothetical protein
MKSFYPFITCLLFTSAIAAQSNHFHYPDAFYFVKEIKIDGLQERPFHFEISVKENPSDSLSKPRIYAIQVRKGKEDVIGKTMVYATPGNGEWKSYTIDGITDKEATRIWFYVAVNGNGVFNFDNLQCSIADINGTLIERDLSNSSFEEQKVLNGYFISTKPSSNIKFQLSPLAIEGKYSLEVTSSNQKPGNSRVLAKN